YSGSTGGSGGRHFHFGIRDNQERPINRVLFGFDGKDTTLPAIKELYAYTMHKHSYVNKANEEQKLRLISVPDGDYTVENIQAYGKIGFVLESTDRQDLAYNSNGVYNIQTFFNGNKKIDIDFKRFSFDETRHLSRFIDYGHYKTQKERLQKLFIEPNNPLSLYKESDNYGYIMVEDSTSSVYKVAVKDFKNNTT